MTALYSRRRVLITLALLLAACRAPAPIAPPLVESPPSPPPLPPPGPPPKPPKLGLVLGGGGARGFAHVGVLKMLDALGARPDLIVGTSAGSVAGALYAAGYSGIELQQIAFELDRATVADWSVFGQGLIRGEALQAFVNKAVKERLLEQLPIPFGCVAARLDTGQAVLFQRGNVGMAVRASSAVPGVFQPVRIGGFEYVDGGLVSPVPIRYARQMGADLIIAVDVSTPPRPHPAEGKLDVLLRTFDIMGKSIREAELPQADIVIRPDLTDITATDFASKQRAILQGEKAVLAALPHIRAALGARVPPPLTHTTAPARP